MKLKKISAAVALLGALVGQQAMAASTNWANHDLLEGGISFQMTGGIITVNDTYSFSLASGYTYDVTSMLLGMGVAGYEVFDSSNASLGSFNVGSGFHTLTLAAGAYKYVVSGVASGLSYYSVSSAITATTPVPEPETYAMMLAGLGALGFLASRRRG